MKTIIYIKNNYMYNINMEEYIIHSKMIKINNIIKCIECFENKINDYVKEINDLKKENEMLKTLLLYNNSYKYR